ncbi:MAG: hypothetical protein SFV15_15685 [Polyangiaceae bacterium]|nr:hypothetical protein [Polyangiaceae bacterium]
MVRLECRVLGRRAFGWWARLWQELFWGSTPVTSDMVGPVILDRFLETPATDAG